MKFAINQATLMNTPMESFLKSAREAGFSGVELRKENTFEYLDSHSVRELIAQIELYALDVVSWNAIEGFNLCSENEFEKILSYTRKLMEIGQKIDCDLIITVPSMIDAKSPDEGTAEKIIRKTASRLSEIRKIADQYSFKVAFEPLGFSNCSVRTLDDALKVLKLSEEDAFPPSGLVIDTFHYFLAHNDLTSLRNLPGDRLWLIHINDVDLSSKDKGGLTDNDRVLPGEGSFDLKGFLKTAEGLGYDDFISIELFNEEFMKLPAAEAAKKAYNSIKSLLN